MLLSRLNQMGVISADAQILVGFLVHVYYRLSNLFINCIFLAWLARASLDYANIAIVINYLLFVIGKH